MVSMTMNGKDEESIGLPTAVDPRAACSVGGTWRVALGCVRTDVLRV